MNAKYLSIGTLCVGAILILSAFGGDKITLEEQLKKVDAVVSENVAIFEGKKRAECKAMAAQKAIGVAEMKWAEESKMGVAKPSIAVTKPTQKGTKTPVKKGTTPTPAPVVTPTTPANDNVTTGRRVDPATNVKEVQTTGRKIDPATNVQEVQTTGRRKTGN